MRRSVVHNVVSLFFAVALIPANATSAGLAPQAERASTTSAPAETPTSPTLPPEWVDTFRWRCIGPANMGGRVVDVAVYEKDPCIWWVATASGGLLKTTNNGITFEHQFDHENTVSIGDVAVAASDPNLV